MQEPADVVLKRHTVTHSGRGNGSRSQNTCLWCVQAKWQAKRTPTSCRKSLRYTKAIPNRFTKITPGGLLGCFQQASGSHWVCKGGANPDARWMAIVWPEHPWVTGQREECDCFSWCFSWCVRSETPAWEWAPAVISLCMAAFWSNITQGTPARAPHCL